MGDLNRIFLIYEGPDVNPGVGKSFPVVVLFHGGWWKPKWTKALFLTRVGGWV